MGIDIIGHRGARSYAPENTLSGIEFALANDITYLDLDIVVTKDKVIVAYHDLIINPSFTCDMLGNYLADSMSDLLLNYSPQQISALTVKNINYETLLNNYKIQLNPKSSYSSYFPKQKTIKPNFIPKLEDIYNYIKRHEKFSQIKLQLEIKNNYYNLELSYNYTELAHTIVNFITLHNLTNIVKIQAFDWRILTSINELNPRIKTAYLIDDDFYNEWKNRYQDHYLFKMLEDAFTDLELGSVMLTLPQISDKCHFKIIELIKKIGGYSYEPEDSKLSLSQLDYAHSIGLKVFVWGYPENSGVAFNRDLVDRLYKWGVDGITADDPIQTRNICLNMNNLL